MSPRGSKPLSPFVEDLEDDLVDRLAEVDEPPTLVSLPAIRPMPLAGGQAPPVLPPMRQVDPPVVATPPPRTRWAIPRAIVAVLLIVLASMVAFGGWISGASFESKQGKAFDAFAKARLLIKDGELAGRPWPDGAPVALLRFPKFNRNLAVFSGIGRTELRRGPGYDPESAFPGSPGNSIIVGKQTTYGAPFARLAEFAVGDQIILSTPAGNVAFQVASKGKKDVDDPTINRELPPGQSQLTLITNEGLLGSDRMVVTALPVAGGIDSTIKLPAIAPTDGTGFSFLLLLGLATIIGFLVYAALTILPLFMARRSSIVLVLPFVLALSLPTLEQLMLLVPRAY